MPQTANQPTLYAEPVASTTPSPNGRPANRQVSAERVVSHSHTNWPRVILAAGGSGAGAAFVGGSIGGPIGAVGAGALGVVLGLLIQRSHKSK